MNLLLVVKESSIFTHKFNFDARDDAVSVIKILTTWTSLIELLIQNQNHFKNFQNKNSGCYWILIAMEKNTILILREIPNTQATVMSGIPGGCNLLFFTK
jgi:hypothetical protein